MSRPTGTSSVLTSPRTVYECPVEGQVFEIDERYQNLLVLGKGAYGMVCVADDTVTGNRVAIKRITNVWRNLGDAKRVLREVKLLRYFTSQRCDAHLVEILDLMVSPQKRDFDTIYIVTNLMETTLRNVIVSGQPLEETHYKFFMYQLLKCLKFVHSAGVVHRDLKPSNILVNASCELRVCDFGLARPMKDDGMTPYVQTRWYRAPELLCNTATYDAKVDLWSVGCILAELLARRPLFPGDSPRSQLHKIVKIRGTPTKEDLAGITDTTALATIHEVGPRDPRDLHTLLPKAPADAIDLLDKLLQFNPAKRLSVEDAISHRFLSEYHSWEGVVEPTWQHRPIKFDFDRSRLSKPEIQVRVIAEINRHYPPAESTGEVVPPAIPSAPTAAPVAIPPSDPRAGDAAAGGGVSSASTTSEPRTAPPSSSAAGGPSAGSGGSYPSTLDVSGLSSPVPELSLSAVREQATAAKEESLAKAARRSRAGLGLSALSSTPPPPPPPRTTAPAATAAAAATAAPAAATTTATDDLTASLAKMMQSQMSQLTQQIVAALEPTNQRVARLERVVDKLSKTVGADLSPTD